MEPRVLLLNASYEPLMSISWQKAICLWFDEKVEIVREYANHKITSVRRTINCPAVVRLLSYVRVKPDRIKFNRINVYTRDDFSCQYCGSSPGVKGLTYDHVIPRSKGGKTDWTNIVTACYSCNSKKGSRTPEEAKMRLRSQPVRPKVKAYAPFSVTRDIPTEWLDFVNEEIR